MAPVWRRQDVQHRLWQQVRHFRRRNPVQARSLDHRRHHDLDPSLHLHAATVRRRNWKIDSKIKPIPTRHARPRNVVFAGPQRLSNPPLADDQLSLAWRRRCTKFGASSDRIRFRGRLSDEQGRFLPDSVLEALRHQTTTFALLK